jgi:hypothetical protein
MDKSLINPYAERGMVRDFKTRFFGRKRELREVFSRLATMQSVSIVGERRIGKSSFLTRIANPNTSEGELDSSFDLHYLDLQRVFSAEEFYDRACKALGREPNDSRLSFEAAIEKRKVVLCLDEFEQAYKEDFGSEFFNTLRSLAQTGNLALVVATQESLDELHRLYLQDEDVTSKFHNIFARMELDELAPEEAREMVAATRNGHRFNDSEVSRILKLAGNHPYWLGVACALTYEAKQKAKAAETEVDFTGVDLEFREEFDGTISKASDARRAATRPEPQPLRQPPMERAAAEKLPAPSTDLSLNPLLLFAAALFFVIGAVNIWDASQRQNPVSLSVSAVCFFLTLVLMLTETVRFGRQAWRSWRSR